MRPRSAGALVLALALALALAMLGRMGAQRLSKVRSPAGDVPLPALGLGTAGLQGATFESVIFALAHGVRVIDTAQAQEWYDEISAGRAVREFLRTADAGTEVRIVTKIHPRSYELGLMREALERSRENFRGVRLHVVLLHAPFCWEGHCDGEIVPWQQAWRNLEALKDEFGIAHIGVSNFDLPLLEELVMGMANRKVSVVQNWMDPLHQDAQVRGFCAEHGIQYMAYSSFGTQWREPNPVLAHPLLRELAAARAWTVPQLLLAWLHHENVVAVPRSRRLDHLAANFAVCAGASQCTQWREVAGDLSDNELAQIRQLDGSMGTPWD